MLSRAIAKIARDDSSSNADILRNVSACKTDVLSGSDGGAEARRLFANTTAYDADIVAVRRALAKGSAIVNVVCRGYGNEPQKALTNLIVNAALVDPPTMEPDSAEYDEDRRRRMSRLQDSIIGRRHFHYPTNPKETEKAREELDRQLLGETRWDPDSSYNAVLAFIVRDPNNPMALPAGDVPMGAVGDGQLAMGMLMRPDDIICDPDTPDSYLYPYLSETGTSIGSLEAAAKEKRKEFRHSLLINSENPIRATRDMSDAEKTRLGRAAAQMNQFYHALFNVQGFGTGEGWRFIPYLMDNSSVYGREHVSPWGENSRIEDAARFVDISKGIPSLDEIGDFDEISLEPDNDPAEDTGTEDTGEIDEPPVSGALSVDNIRLCINWIRSVAPGIGDEQTDELPTPEQIAAAVRDSADDRITDVIASRATDLNMVSALVAIMSTDFEEWLDTGPSRRSVTTRIRPLETGLEEAFSTPNEVEEVAEEAAEDAPEPISDVDIREVVAQHAAVNRHITERNMSLSPQYAVERVETGDANTVAHRRIQNPTAQQIRAESDSLNALVDWWTTPGNIPQYVLDNLTPETVYAWMMASAPRFGRMRNSMRRRDENPDGEDYVDYETLGRVYDVISRMRRADSRGRMSKKASFRPERIRGFDELNGRIVGTRGKRTSEIVRGRARSWAMTNALGQIVNSFQGVPDEPFEDNTASGSVGRSALTSQNESTITVDVSEIVGSHGDGAYKGVSVNAGMTWGNLSQLLTGTPINLISDDGAVTENNSIESFNPPSGVSNINDPVDVATSPSCTIVLSDPIRSEIGRSFRVAFPGIGGVGPKDDDLLAFEYGAENVDRVRGLQSKYNASINRSPLPNWAPNPYCFV